MAYSFLRIDFLAPRDTPPVALPLLNWVLLAARRAGKSKGLPRSSGLYKQSRCCERLPLYLTATYVQLDALMRALRVFGKSLGPSWVPLEECLFRSSCHVVASQGIQAFAKGRQQGNAEFVLSGKEERQAVPGVEVAVALRDGNGVLRFDFLTAVGWFHIQRPHPVIYTRLNKLSSMHKLVICTSQVSQICLNTRCSISTAILL